MLPLVHREKLGHNSWFADIPAWRYASEVLAVATCLSTWISGHLSNAGIVSKRVAQVCQHQLSFLLYSYRPIRLSSTQLGLFWKSSELGDWQNWLVFAKTQLSWIGSFAMNRALTAIIRVQGIMQSTAHEISRRDVNETWHTLASLWTY